MSHGRQPLTPDFFDEDAQTVAQRLLGAYLVSESDATLCVGRIVETEAYPGPHDPASHAAAAIGRTKRNDPMFGSPGTAYIHLNFGIHWCLNAVVGPEGYPAAVLIRAVEPIDGIEAMRQRRRGRSERDLTSGPARLTQALGIGPELQRHPLYKPPLLIVAGDPVASVDVVSTTRIGISRGKDKQWRFFDGRSAFVSRSVAARASSGRL